MKKIFWEVICYIGLALCIIGQITVGKYYVLAQSLYLIANLSAVIRDFSIKLPTANKVKDIFFTAITIALLLLRLL